MVPDIQSNALQYQKKEFDFIGSFLANHPDCRKWSVAPISPLARRRHNPFAAMRFAATVVALLWVGVNARNVPRFGQSVFADDELDVPGQSPLKFCEADRAKDIITIEEVILTPNPPQA